MFIILIMYLISSINNVKTDWKNILQKLDLTSINKFLEKEEETYQGEIKIFPPKKLIFNCFNFFNIKDTRVVILGQDPYINEGEAMGLSFSVPEGTKIPPSLRNILKEVNRSFDYNIDVKKYGDLTKWAKQGIILLNTALTVRQYKSNSHKTKWKKVTDHIIKYISENCSNIVFILWGNNAKKKAELIDDSKHLILESGHPSPLNRKGDFKENNHFIKCNEYLCKYTKGINWEL